MKRKLIIIMLSVMCCFAGCRNSYISNKNTENIEENNTIQDTETTEKNNTIQDKETTEENNTIQDKETTEENYTEPNTDDDDLEDFSMSTSLNVFYKDSSEGKFISARTEGLEFNEDENVFAMNMYCSVNASSDWNEFPVKIYLIDNGELIPFSIDGGEYKPWNEIMCTNDKDKGVEFSFERLELNSKAGQLNVLVIFNPTQMPGKPPYDFGGTMNYKFNYLNPKYSGEHTSDIEQADGEYIDIPQEHIENARVTDIGPDDYLNEDYTFKGIHYPNDLEVNGVNELYLYMNKGEEVSGCGMVGIICDGELLQFDDGNYFKKINSYNGEKTFRYNLSEFDNIGEGLHYFQVIYMPLDDVENKGADVSQRYRVNIRGDK